MMSRRRSPGFSQLCCGVSAWFIVAVLLSIAAQAETTVQLRFKNGDIIAGTIATCSKAQHVGLQSKAFDRPLEFQVDRIGLLERQEELQPTAPGELSFLLSNHATIVGKLVALKEDSVTVQSRSLGEVTFPRRLLSEIVDSGGLGKLQFIGPRRSQDWKSTPKPDSWVMEGSSVSTSMAGSVIEFETELPPIAEVRLKLSWSKTPNFSMAFGSSGGPVGQLRGTATVRLETWAGTLAMIHETANETHFVSLGEISSNSGRLDLVLYIDQVKGNIVACSPTGQKLGSLVENDIYRAENRTIKILNAVQGKDALRIERIEIRQWSGRLPGQADAKGGIVDKDGKSEAGRIDTFDAGNQALTLIRDDGATVTVPIARLGRAAFNPEPLEDSTKEQQVEVQYADSSSCVGTWQSSAENKLHLRLVGIDTPIVASFDQVLGVTGNSIPFVAPEATGRIGTLESEQIKLSGSLSDSAAPGELIWLPQCASSPSKLLPEFKGKIVYEPAEAPKRIAQTNRPVQRLNVGGIVAQGAQIFFRNGRVVPNAATPNLQTTTVSAGLKFRTGDSAAGKVSKIDEQGVTFMWGDKTVVAPHHKMESVTLVDRAKITELPPDKLKHLMTIPRAAKADPPTHLFVSVGGDYLRGRLVKYVDGRVTAEIRLENVEFPADSIAQIFWLHSRNWDENKTDAASDKNNQAAVESPQTPTAPTTASHESRLLQVHALTRNEKAMTFTPNKLFSKELEFGKQEQFLQGESDLLGHCEVLISDVTMLLIGRDVGEMARQVQKDAWVLSVAAQPKVYQEGDLSTEASSPLVGKPAPDFTLKTTTKKNFELKSLKGHVTVLDFWASWCGPCMQTMPEVERIVSAAEANDVDLIAVNLQESPERAMAAIERLDLKATVVLDIDGEVAQKYQASAIPQTVIIDRAGNVTHVFVGGGPKFLKQFEEALMTTIKSEAQSPPAAGR